MYWCYLYSASSITSAHGGDLEPCLSRRNLAACLGLKRTGLAEVNICVSLVNIKKIVVMKDCLVHFITAFLRIFGFNDIKDNIMQTRFLFPECDEKDGGLRST